MEFKGWKVLLLLVMYISSQVIAKSNTKARLKQYAENRRQINKYIRNLHYDPNEVLTHRGEHVELIDKPNGKLDAQGNYLVTRLEKKSIDSKDLNLGVIESMREHVFPGVILLANDELLNNKPTPLVVDRVPIRYTVGLQGLKYGDSSFVTEPVFSNYFPNHERILNTWFEKYPQDHVIPAEFTVDKSVARSKEQLTVKFGLDASIISSKIDFEYVENNKKLVYVYKFQQVFYTVSVDLPKEPAELFSSKVHRRDIDVYVNDSNPPVLVDSVTYGRIIYVIAETTSTDSDAKLALESLFSDVSLDARAKTNYQFKNLTIHASVLGGNIEEIKLVDATDFSEVDRVIVEHANFSRGDPGVPISYSMIFLKDNRVACAQAFTEYVDQVQEVMRSGSLRLENFNAYFTKWFIEWDEFKYTENGTKVYQHNAWDENGESQHLSFTKYVRIPGNAENIHLKIMWAGIFDDWKLLREVYNMPLLPGGRSIKADNCESDGGSPEVIIHPDNDLN